MMGSHDLDEGGPELTARPRVFAVEPGRVGPPAARDLADRGGLLEPEFQEGDPTPGVVVGLPAPRLEEVPGLTHERAGPRPLDVARRRIDPGREPDRHVEAGVLRKRVDERERTAATLDAPSDVADDAEQERAEGRDAIRIGAVEHAVGAKALDEDILHGVVDLAGSPRPAPAGREQGADERLVAAGEALPALVLTHRRLPDQAPAGRLAVVTNHRIAPHHASSPSRSLARDPGPRGMRSTLVGAARSAPAGRRRRPRTPPIRRGDARAGVPAHR